MIAVDRGWVAGRAAAMTELERRARFDTLYARYQSPLYNYIVRLVGDRDAADDLLQDTFVKIYKALDHGPDGDGERPWVYRIATNTSYDLLRRRRLISWLPWTTRDDARLPDGVGSGDLGDRYALSEGVQDALAALPPSLRAPLLLHVVHGLSYAAIAEALVMSEGAVKMRVSRARARFKECYRDETPLISLETTQP